MDLPAPSRPPLHSRLLPFWAVLTDDLRQTMRHWALVAWMLLGLAANVVWLAAAREPGSESSRASTAATAVPAFEASLQSPVSAAPAPSTNPRAQSARDLGATGEPEATAADFAAQLMRYHFLLWVSFVIALGTSSIAGESDVASDSVLCRGIARWQYYLGKCSGRLVVVLAAFLLLTAPAILVGAMRFSNDLSTLGTIRVLAIGATFLGGVALIGVAGGIWFRNALTGVAVMWMLIYGFGIVVALLGITDLSPLALVETLPDRFRSADPYPTHQLPALLVWSALTATVVSLVAFSFRDV